MNDFLDFKEDNCLYFKENIKWNYKNEYYYILKEIQNEGELTNLSNIDLGSSEMLKINSLAKYKKWQKKWQELINLNLWDDLRNMYIHKKIRLFNYAKSKWIETTLKQSNLAIGNKNAGDKAYDLIITDFINPETNEPYKLDVKCWKTIKAITTNQGSLNRLFFEEINLDSNLDDYFVNKKIFITKLGNSKNGIDFGCCLANSYQEFAKYCLDKQKWYNGNSKKNSLIF